MARPRKEEPENAAQNEQETGVTDSWMTVIQVQTSCAKSRAWVHRQIKDGVFHPKTVNNRLMFDPAEVDQFVKDTDDSVMLPAAQVIQSSAQANEVALSYLDKILDQVTEAWKDVLAVAQQQNKELHDALIAKDEKLNEQAELAEKLRSEEHERRMIELREDRRAKMQDRALDSLKGIAPLAMAHLATKYPELKPLVVGMMKNQVGQTTAQAPGDNVETKRKLDLADGLLTIFAAMPDDKFASMKDGLGIEAFEILSEIRKAVQMGKKEGTQ